MKANIVVVTHLIWLNGGSSKHLRVPNSKLTSSVLPEVYCFASLSLKPWSQKCRLKTFTNCCAVPVFDWFKLQCLRFNQHHEKVSTGRCAVPQTQGYQASNLSIVVHWGSCVYRHCRLLVAELTRVFGLQTTKETQGLEFPHHCHLGRLKHRRS